MPHPTAFLLPNPLHPRSLLTNPRALSVVAGPDGTPVAVSGDRAAALETAREAGLRAVIADRAETRGELLPNPPPSPDQAWQRVGRLRIDESALRMTLAEAHARLVRFFPTYRVMGKRKKGLKVVERLEPGKYFTPILAYQTPLGMSDVLLGQNYKTEKTDRRFGATKALGLSLLPNFVWNQIMGRGREGPVDPAVVAARRSMNPMIPNVDVCVGASQACRDACLVYTGRNDADPYNVLVKSARQSALFFEPDAFGRMLYEACVRHLAASKKNRVRPFVRLNVYSDIPWELVFPSLFQRLPDLQFYDYTKVPGRRTPSNYDLTFSYSGTNIDYMRSELEYGRRVAVVFFVKPYNKKKKVSYQPPSLDVAGTAYRVVDGDISDLRPLDPSRVIVGLAFKSAKKKAVKPADVARTGFVVQAHQVGGQLAYAITPSAQPGVLQAAAQDTLPG